MCFNIRAKEANPCSAGSSLVRRELVTAEYISTLSSNQDMRYNSLEVTRGGLTIWKLGHCPRAQGQ
ncbi:unnamed protein product [Staurois parvus]|uniref:Uncharacterized protein n=1 Tax=Staurois parvus TaxID=386267 RepID=A0ABN9CVZ0_9NEOB|nr:unnamed protein product [Staurois parvus]